MRDQLIMARAYVNIASIHNDARLVQDLKARIKEIMRMLEDVSIDAELPKGCAAFFYQYSLERILSLPLFFALSTCYMQHTASRGNLLRLSKYMGGFQKPNLCVLTPQFYC